MRHLRFAARSSSQWLTLWHTMVPTPGATCSWHPANNPAAVRQAPVEENFERAPLQFAASACALSLCSRPNSACSCLSRCGPPSACGYTELTQILHKKLHDRARCYGHRVCHHGRQVWNLVPFAPPLSKLPRRTIIGVTLCASCFRRAEIADRRARSALSAQRCARQPLQHRRHFD